MFGGNTVFLSTKRVYTYSNSSILQFEIENIVSAQTKKIFLYTITLTLSNGDLIVIGELEKVDAEKFIKLFNEQKENFKSFKVEINKTIEQDITDKIEKLSELHKEGVLTDYEFSVKKMELLEQLKK